MSAGGQGRPAPRSSRRLESILRGLLTVDDDAGPARSPEGSGSAVGRRMRVIQGRYLPFLSQGGAGNRRLVLGGALVFGALAVAGLPELVSRSPFGNDIEIPLRAAERWSAGGEPYPASAMLVSDGPDLPLLYPPFVLPLLAPLSHLPHALIWIVWVAVCLAAAVWTCRRLGLPWLAVPLALAWPPCFVGIILGNVQILHVAAFVALFYVPGVAAPVPKKLLGSNDLRNGAQAAAAGVLKVTQLVTVLFLARRRFRAAVFAVIMIAAIVLLTLPFTGISVYGDWLAQLGRANDPSWHQGGVPLSRLLGLPDLPFELAGLAVVLTVRGRDSAAWLGIAMIFMSPSIHDYGFLFVVPALLTLRRDLSIVLAALFLGYYHTYAWWLCMLLVSYFLIASVRWTWLRATSGSPVIEPAAS